MVPAMPPARADVPAPPLSWLQQRLGSNIAAKGSGCRVQGLGFRVQGLGVQGFGFRGSGFRVQGLGFYTHI